ncbi:MAG: DUF1292 domain-containing protein [Lachnospiraceae bacterium]|nr:DUF1292 domain-containing protein [Lachnospiraceae bacterium]
MADLFDEEEIYTLTDEEGNETQFELLGSHELDGVVYLALIPIGEGNKEDEEYVILRMDQDENGEDMLVTIDDDDEFDRIADIFDDELFGEIDYDAQ